MLHFYDESPSSPREIRSRLRPALHVLAADVPCVVWGEDALSFMFLTPTAFFNLNILVPGSQVVDAALALEAGGEYTILDPDEDDFNREKRIVNPDRPHLFPQSCTLRKNAFEIGITEEPESITVHPASFWQFGIHDPTRTMRLSPPLGKDYDNFLFPTDVAFVDSVIDTMLEPPAHGGLIIDRLECRLEYWLRYLILYYLSENGERLTSTGEYVPRIFRALAGVKEENRDYFRKYIDFAVGDPVEGARHRMEMLKKKSERLGTPLKAPVMPIPPLLPKPGRIGAPCPPGTNLQRPLRIPATLRRMSKLIR